MSERTFTQRGADLLEKFHSSESDANIHPEYLRKNTMQMRAVAPRPLSYQGISKRSWFHKIRIHFHADAAQIYFLLDLASRPFWGRPVPPLHIWIWLLGDVSRLVSRERDCHGTASDLCAIYTGITTWSVMRSGMKRRLCPPPPWLWLNFN